MIGESNGKAAKLPCEFINITLLTNQPSHEDIMGLSVNISYEGFSKDYAWEGEEITVKIPADVQYTVVFSEVRGYKTPESVSYKAVEDNARDIEALYQTEVVIIDVSSSNDESMVGQVVTINGTAHTWKGSPIVQKIPFGTDYEVSVSDREDYITPSVQSFTASQQSRTVSMLYIYDPIVDLSKVDIYGNPIAQNTANCYVIKESGKYMFPIAYGAAIKNGVANTEAYTNNGGENSHNFVNYLGNVITSPYVEVDTSKQAASVQISIADTDNAVSDLQIIEEDDCRYVSFEVLNVPVTGANAVISVKDSSGVIMWSWHIWLWSDDLSVVEITNATNVKYNILPVNLGSKWDDEAHTYIKNWFYQWGRPNPMLLPSAYNLNSYHTSYGDLSFVGSVAAPDIQTGICNPTTFYTTSVVDNIWFGETAYYNLWDSQCAETGYADNDVKKTVYDPCPVGFKVPNGNTFTGLSIISNANGIVKLTRYNGDTIGVGFPLSGDISSGQAKIENTDNRGYMWTSASRSQEYAWYSQLRASLINPRTYVGRGYGYSIRPVQDIDLALPTHKLTINVSGDTEMPSGYEVKVYSVTESTDESTGEVTETLGDVLSTQTIASAIHEITWGTKYKIVCSDAEGFVAPAESQTYVADTEYRTFDALYSYDPGVTNPTNGVWIQSVDGKFYSENNWDGSKVADCVAVITDACRFGIELIETSGLKAIHSSHEGALANYMTAIPNETQAKADYNGAANTTNIMKLQSGTNYAAGWCNAYTFPSGKKGFLPAAGQWWAVYSNKDAIDSALVKAGGTALLTSNTGYYWTSTYWGKDNYEYRHCWVINLKHGKVFSALLSGTRLNDSNYVRAFCSI